MARIAVVRSFDNVCVNVIMADVHDPVHSDYFLVDVDNMNCDIGWVYDPVVNDFINLIPPPPDEGGE